MEPKYSQKIAEKLNLSVKQVGNVHNLNAEGATIPFMARYRKEVTGNLDEVAIGNIVEQVRVTAPALLGNATGFLGEFILIIVMGLYWATSRERAEAPLAGSPRRLKERLASYSRR